VKIRPALLTLAFQMDDTAQLRHAARVDIGIALVLLAVCAMGTWSLANSTVLYDFDFGSDPGPGLVPALLIAILAGCALIMLGLSGSRLWRTKAAGDPGERIASSAKSLILPALMTIALLLYAEMLEAIGFLETTIVFTALWCLLIGIQDDGKPTPRRLVLYAAEAIAITGGIYLVFAKLIHVPLP